MDGLFFEWLFSLSHKNAVLDGVLIFFGRYVPYLLGVAFLLFLLKKGEWRRRLLLFSEAAMGVVLSRGIVTEALRFFYDRPRPAEALEITALIEKTGGAFPSGHMAFFFVLGTMLFLYQKKWGAWFLSIAFVVGLGRIAMGVHWPFDILGGMVIGVVSGVFVHWLIRPSLEKLEEAA